MPTPRPSRSAATSSRARTRAALTAAAAALALALGACSSEDEPVVRTAAVERGDVQETVQTSGTVQPRTSATVSAPASGTVTTLAVTDGQQVAAGDVLLVLDSPQARDALAQAEAADRQAAAAVPSGGGSGRGDVAGAQRRARAQAEAAFERARAQAEALPDPAARDAALAAVDASRAHYDLQAAQTQALVDQVQAGLGSVDEALGALGQAQRVQTRAAVAAARATVDALTVRAPVAGRVSLAAAGSGGGGAGLPAGAEQLLQQQGLSLPGGALGGVDAGGGTGPVIAEGAAVSAGSPLLSVVDASVLSWTADVDETDVLQVRPGLRARISVDAVQDAEYAGTVTSVDPTATTGSGGGVTYTVRLSYDGGTRADGSPAPEPLPGMSAVVSLVVADAPGVVRVPSSALVRAGDGGGDAVLVVEDGRARLREVAVGARGERDVEVASGLRAGERVVVEGVESVTDGEQVP
ncbi:efflux RND transporter periplasmic adaptor subunit [Kineococcus terrestris]|uniref:efflux RND transporter periplasmic adaptor subunit n=1 Tax=Kineococcus terrestris TaxID=2044856 RepID=UPI0034DB354E